MEISKTECKRILRTLELKAYRSVVDALRAQGALTAYKHEVLKNLAATLKVSEERYRSEMRRAANDDLLNKIAQSTNGNNTEMEWRAESVKKVPLTPMIASHTAFTVLADAISDIVSIENEKFSGSGELMNIVESYKCRNDENLEKYQSSKALDSLLKKRRDHHENSILSELENIKLNNNYHPSPVKSGYIEISYEESSSSVETNDQNFSFDDATSSLDTPMFSSNENSTPSKNRFRNKNLVSRDGSSSSSRKINSKSRLKLKRNEKNNSDEKISTSNASKNQNTGKTRNLRSKPSKKYTWNSVEIRSFEEEDTAKAHLSQTVDKPTSNTRSDVEQSETTETSKDSHVEISYSENNDDKSLKNRKSKQRVRNRTKFIRQIKMNRGRKFNPLTKVKPDAAKEVPSRSARFSSRNARRRNYARIASGDYDLMEFEKIRKEKKIEEEPARKEEEEDDDAKYEEDIEETDDDSLSDSSAAPIEISYSNPAAPKCSDYDLDGVSSTYTETDDDMKPHTFNLIPASRRLKMLKKRAASPSGEETPVKQIALSSQSNNDQSGIPTAKVSLFDSNALKKVLAAHESSGNATSSSLSDASDITEAKEILDVPDRTHSDLRETKPHLLIPPRCAPDKRMKPKMKLSEVSTIENLHSLLSKVKEGDLKRFCNESNTKKKSSRKKRERKNSPRSSSPIVNNCNGSFIEVGSDSGSVNEDNCKPVLRNTNSDHPTPCENDAQIIENPKSNNTQVVDNLKPNNADHDLENHLENDARMTEDVTPTAQVKRSVARSAQMNDSLKPSNEVQNTISPPKSDIHITESLNQNNELPNSSSPPKGDILMNEIVKSNDEVQKSQNEPSTEEEVSIVSITIDDIEDPAGSTLSEQLIDIESADIIIGDCGDHNEEFVLTDNTTPTETSKIPDQPDPVIEEPEESMIPPIITAQNDEMIAKKRKLVIVNQPFTKDSESLGAVINHQNTITASKRPIIKQFLTDSADFRYKADADDPSLKKSISKPPELINTVPLAGIPTIINSGKKLGKSLIKTPNATVTKVPKTTNNSPESLQDKIGRTDATTNSTLPKDGKFVLLDTKSITGSKSLLKPIKILPKLETAAKTKAEANCTVRNSNSLGIYSSLENLNKYASSTGSSSNIVRKIIVSKAGVDSSSGIVKNVIVSNAEMNSGSTIVKKVLVPRYKVEPGPNIIKKVLVSKSGVDSSTSIVKKVLVPGYKMDSSTNIKQVFVSKSEIDSKRLGLSQALERSLKSVEATKNQCNTLAANISENTESAHDKDGIVEISSNDSRRDDIISNLNEIETVLANDVTSKNVDSESIFSTEELEIKTFFSKNITRKQS